MPHQLVALFRGINVGGKNLLPMKELSSVLEDIGYTSIQTYIQSGNVVMESKHAASTNSAKLISDSIQKRKGFDVRVLLLSQKQFDAAIDGNPFPTNFGKSLHFYFLEELPTSPDLSKLDSLKAPTESYALRDKVFYLLTPDGIGRSKLAASVEKTLGVSTTARNWNTVAQLHAMLDG